jgi:cell division initiation protein
MTTTPVEIRHLQLGRRLFGYRRDRVDEALSEIATSFEEVWRDRGELSDKVEALEAELTRLRETEALLKNTLIAAERAAADSRERAREEADLIVNEAHAEARSITRAAQAERERLLADVRKVRALLHSALQLADQAESTKSEAAKQDAPAAADEAVGWPKLEDTSPQVEPPARPFVARDRRGPRSA